MPMGVAVGCCMNLGLSECVESSQLSPTRHKQSSLSSSHCCVDSLRIYGSNSPKASPRKASFSPRASADNHSALSATAMTKREQQLTKADEAWQESTSIYLQNSTMWQQNLELDYETRHEEGRRWEDMLVGDFMCRDVVCLRPDIPLKTAAKILAKIGISGAPVVDAYEGDAYGAGKLVGVLSQRDILWKETVPYPGEDDHMHRINEGPMSPVLYAQMRKITAKTVEDAMTSDTLYIEEDAMITDAAEMMLNHNVARLPVVAPREDNKPGMTVVGIVTCHDILRHAMRLM
ncbi:hypothetical protein CLOM_g18884 [Closterium sp. NIES-68]|nr:hypothetical protein CLOM_g18884 [Closterium sp. NIES-68]GJP86059.1 hypothetical protein CLOP_g16122 [Closterium sp. NIES-67]